MTIAGCDSDGLSTLLGLEAREKVVEDTITNSAIGPGEPRGHHWRNLPSQASFGKCADFVCNPVFRKSVNPQGGKSSDSMSVRTTIKSRVLRRCGDHPIDHLFRLHGSAAAVHQGSLDEVLDVQD